MKFKWPYVLLEYGFLFVSFFSKQPFRYGGRFIYLFITVLWKKKRNKTLNRHNFLTYFYMPILSRDVLCIYCELLKM